jgi:hypothetical protein
MSGDIHNGHVFAGGEREPGEPEVNCHLARLFLHQTIGIDPGQRLDECALAVIDVTGGANYKQNTTPRDYAAR